MDSTLPLDAYLIENPVLSWVKRNCSYCTPPTPPFPILECGTVICSSLVQKSRTLPYFSFHTSHPNHYLSLVSSASKRYFRFTDCLLSSPVQPRYSPTLLPGPLQNFLTGCQVSPFFCLTVHPPQSSWRDCSGIIKYNSNHAENPLTASRYIRSIIRIPVIFYKALLSAQRSDLFPPLQSHFLLSAPHLQYASAMLAFFLLLEHCARCVLFLLNFAFIYYFFCLNALHVPPSPAMF